MMKLCSSMALAVVFLAGCSGDDISFAPEAGTDAGDGGTLRDATTGDTHVTESGGDAVLDAAAEADAEAGPQRVLVTANLASTSELVAVNVATGNIDGTLTYPGYYGTTDAHSKLFPFVLEQLNNVVARLDATKPWVIDSSWNVNEPTDSGYAYTDPYAAIVGAGDTTYALLYNRNQIAVFDSLDTVDAGSVKTIDLTPLVQANGDGFVEMTGGAYDAATKILYVVLGNIDQNTVMKPTFDLICTGTTSTVIGIDTTNNSIKNLGGTGPMGSIALQGFDPVEGGVVYDEANTRLLILEAGCNTPGDGGPGPLTKRGVEAVDLSTGSTSILIDTSNAFPAGSGYPTGFVYISKNSAVLGFDQTGSEVYAWDPTTSALGAQIKNAPDLFTSDGAGNLLGTSSTEDDAGTTVDVVKVNIATGTRTVIASNPFGTADVFLAGVDVWPHP